MAAAIQRDLFQDLESGSLYLDTVPKGGCETPAALRMVGTGKACDTGGLKVPMVCPKCHAEVQVNTVTCGRVECPTCWPTWARRGAERAAARVWGYREASHTKYLPRHATFDLKSVDWKEAKKTALKLGFIGGVIVIHPWRIREEYKPLLAEAAEKTGKSRYELAREMAGTVDVLEFSPHAHVLCYGKGVLIEKGSSDYQYRMIRRCNTIHAAEAVVYYLLSHTYIPETPGKRVYRYFGVCSPQRLKPSWQSKRTDCVRCPHCNEPLVYPGSREIKEVTSYIAGGWYFVKPKKKLTGIGLVAAKREAPPPPPGLCSW